MVNGGVVISNEHDNPISSEILERTCSAAGQCGLEEGSLAGETEKSAT